MKIAEDQNHNLYVHIYTNDHEPAHVHIFKGTKNDTNKREVKINIGDENKPPSIVKANPKMRNKDIEAAWRLVAENQEVLLKKWESIHGDKKMGNEPR